MLNNSPYYWYKSSDTELHKDVFTYVKKLEDEQDYRSTENLRNLKLYGNYDTLGLRQYNFARAEPSSAVNNKLTWNVIQSMVDTVHSKITKNKPKPMFLTNAGDWSARSKAKKLTNFVEAQFMAMDFYDISSICFLDSLIFGTGAAKFYTTPNNEIKSERVFIDEIVVDDNEAIYGTPRQMHQKKWIHREVLKEMFPNASQAIDAAGKTSSTFDITNVSYGTYNDMILVVESWKLPSGKDAGDGKHAMCIENHTLFSEKYEKDYFPFVFWRWIPRSLGFFGQGLSEQLTGIQLEINKILRTIQVSMHLVSIPKIFVEASSKIIDSHIDNKIGGIIKYVGQRPYGEALGSIPAELFSHLDRLYSRAYEIAGISQLSAQSAKPAGLNSGKALRIYNDIETERFMASALRYEKAHLDAAKIVINMAKAIAEENKGSFPVKMRTKYGYEIIDWADINLQDDQYIMQMYPVSSLSSTPSARFQEVQELMQSGFIGKEEGLKLLNFPDLQDFYNFKNAPLEDIDRTLELIVEKGDYQSPEPFQNLEAGKVKFQEAYLFYKAQGAPEDVLELIQRWISDAEELQKRAMAQIQEEQMAMQQKAQLDAEEAKAMEQEAQAMEGQAPLPLVNPATAVPTLPGDDQGLLTSSIEEPLV